MVCVAVCGWQGRSNRLRLNQMKWGAESEMMIKQSIMGGQMREVSV